MIIKLNDIPAVGKDVEFDLDIESLNSRINSSEYVFSKAPKVKVNLVLKGNTLSLKANLEAEFLSNCSRCNKEVTENITLPYSIILKPKRIDDVEELEDLDFGYYSSGEVNCSEIAEEHLILSLPMVVKCKQKECVSTGDSWQFGEEIESSNPFKKIKLH